MTEFSEGKDDVVEGFRSHRQMGLVSDVSGHNAAQPDGRVPSDVARDVNPYAPYCCGQCRAKERE